MNTIRGIYSVGCVPTSGTIYYFLNGGYAGSVVSGTDGAYAITGLGAGTYTFSDAWMFGGSVVLTTADVVRNLDHYTDLRVRISDGGVPWPSGASVYLFVDGGYGGTAVTDAEGWAHFPFFLPGVVTLFDGGAWLQPGGGTSGSPVTCLTPVGGIAYSPEYELDPNWIAPTWTRVMTGAATIFEGLIDGVMHLPDPGGDQVEQITASDYNVLLDYDVVPHVWRSAEETDKERLTWLFETFGTHGITCGDEVQEVIGDMPGGADGKPEQEFGPSGLRDAAAKILQISGGKLRVDFDLALHHFVTEATASPFNLSDDPNGTTTREYFDFSLEDDSVPKVDEVVVFGAQQAEGAGLLTVTRTASDAPAAAYRRIVPLVDDKLTSVAQCEAAGDAYLTANQGRRTGKLKTIHAGLLGGQLVQITNAGTGLSAEPFAIAGVVMTPDTDRTGIYDVTFGDEPPSQAAIIGGSGGLIERIAAVGGRATDASRRVADLSVGGANLVANSCFANALGATWTVGAQWVFGYTPVGGEVAMWGSKTARAALAAQTAGVLLTASIPVVRLDDYWLSLWTWVRTLTSGTVRLELREYNGADALLASTTIADLTAAETAYTCHRLHMGPNDELGRTGFNADTVAVRLAVYTTGASTLTCDVGGVQIERGKLATAYAPTPQEIADGSIDAATKVIAYSIVAGLIAGHTITGDKMVAHTLTADEIDAAYAVLKVLNVGGTVAIDSTGLAVTGGAISVKNAAGATVLDVNGLGSGIVTAASIDAGAVTADKLSIGTAGGVVPLTNPGFESGDTSGWSTSGSVSARGTTAGDALLPTGTYLCSINGSGYIDQGNVAVRGGECVHLSALLGWNGGSYPSAYFQIWARDAAGADISQLTAAFVVSVATTYTAKFAPLPPGTAYIGVRIICTTSGTQLLIDDVVLSRFGSLISIDGSVVIDSFGVAITNGKLTVTNPGGTVIIDGSSDIFRIAYTSTIGTANQTGTPVKKTATATVATGLAFMPVALFFVESNDGIGNTSELCPQQVISNAGAIAYEYEGWVSDAGSGNTRVVVQTFATTAGSGGTAATYRYYILDQIAF